MDAIHLLGHAQFFLMFLTKEQKVFIVKKRLDMTWVLEISSQTVLRLDCV